MSTRKLSDRGKITIGLLVLVVIWGMIFLVKGAVPSQEKTPDGTTFVNLPVEVRKAYWEDHGDHGE